jgi:hypothetical protein
MLFFKVPIFQVLMLWLIRHSTTPANDFDTDNNTINSKLWLVLWPNDKVEAHGEKDQF